MCPWPGGLSAMKPTVKGNSGMGTGKYCWGGGGGGEGSGSDKTYSTYI
jgi:hypothetical protein